MIEESLRLFSVYENGTLHCLQECQDTGVCVCGLLQPLFQASLDTNSVCGYGSSSVIKFCEDADSQVTLLTQQGLVYNYFHKH